MTSLDPKWIEEFQPSRLVRKCAAQIAAGCDGKPVVDVACGSGRNSLIFSQLGCKVACVDKDLSNLRNEQVRLQDGPFRDASTRLTLYQLDLSEDPWPFTEGSVGAILNVHFLLRSLFPFFESSLIPGGYLLLETVPAHGGNYLTLPGTGDLRAGLEKSFDFEFYRERTAGPRVFKKVTVQLLAKRKRSGNVNGQK